MVNDWVELTSFGFLVWRKQLHLVLTKDVLECTGAVDGMMDLVPASDRSEQNIATRLLACA